MNITITPAARTHGGDAPLSASTARDVTHPATRKLTAGMRTLYIGAGQMKQVNATEAETIQRFESWIIHHGPSLLVHLQHLQRHAMRLAYPA
jgi:hypothetical protein